MKHIGVVPLIFIVIFFGPIISLFSFVGSLELPPIGEFYRSFISTTVQAILSAVFSLGIGTFSAPGLLSTKWKAGLTAILLFPSFLPSLFVILAVLNLISPFPFGVPGVVLAHILINGGLVTVLVAQTMAVKLPRLSEVALVMGVGRWTFFYRVVLGSMKSDLVFIFLTVFTLCFVSFAIPITLGGSAANSIESLIYEKVRVTSEWSQAISLALLQVFVFLGLSLILFKNKVSIENQEGNILLRPFPIFVLVPTFFSICVAIGLVSGLTKGYIQWIQSSGVQGQFWNALLGSVVLGLTTGLLTAALLLLMGASRPREWFHQFMLGFSSPSGVITGLGLFFFYMTASRYIPRSFIPASELGQLLSAILKIGLGLCLLWIPSLYRMKFAGAIKTLDRQWETAYVLGAGPWRYFKSVVFPQISEPVGWLSGMAAFWACGDFAVGQLIAGREITLAQVIHGLVGSYRLELATLLQWCLLVAGAFLFLFFWRIGYVCSHKYRLSKI